MSVSYNACAVENPVQSRCVARLTIDSSALITPVSFERGLLAKEN